MIPKKESFTVVLCWGSSFLCLLFGCSCVVRSEISITLFLGMLLILVTRTFYFQRIDRNFSTYKGICILSVEHKILICKC